MRASVLIGLGALLVSACAVPPRSAYVGDGPASGSVAGGAGLGLGADAAGERCTLQSGAVFCGTWRTPSGQVRPAVGSRGDLAAIATASPWRSALDQRFNCAAPVPTTILGGRTAVEMSCTRRIGGWPQVALAAMVGGQVYVADGILPTEPVLERAIGVLSGTVAASAAPQLPAGQAEGLLAARLAAQPFGANDIARFQALMLAGLRANLDESYVPAEQAYRAALAIQRKTLGASDPATAGATMLVALQLANQGRGPEADALFASASRLASRSANPTAQARLAHYRGLALLDENKPAAALADLETAETGYAALLPASVLDMRAPAAIGGAPRAGAGLPVDPDQQAALIGVVETRRYEAICLRALGRIGEARERIEAAITLADANGLQQRNLAARLFRTEAEIDERLAPGSGAGDLGRASRDFVLAQPGSRPLAQTDLLRAAQSLGRGERARSIGFCRSAMTLLNELKAGTSAELISPCLDAFAAEADADPAARQVLLADMFAASQLVQGSVTSQQIALAAARLETGSRNPAVAAAIRRQQDAALALADLQRERDVGASTANGGNDAAASAALARRVDAAQSALADADAVLQAAAPNYGELVAGAVSAQALLGALEPGEAFVSVVLTPTGGWVFALTDGRIDAARTGADAGAMSALTRRIRDSVEPGPNGLPSFDVAASRAIYDDTIGRVAASVANASSLVVAPAGPLLTVPFELLLSGPADPNSLGQAPFLVRRYAISHVPAPANFVSLRRASTAGRATKPWFGFGDFRPVTLRQAQATFPSGACADSARLFAGLPPLPFAGKELAAARELLGGSADDALLGAAFTRHDVLQAKLDDVRVLHFATHALLPTDLACETEPAIVTSAPPDAPDASGALLTSSDVMGMQLDADVVILSACNSAGPDGSSAGESLSGLARAFFYAGARAVMVTHWSINDQSTAYVVAGTMARLRRGDPAGLAGALRGAQLAMLDGAGHGMPAVVSHPFYWAPFAVVGEGRGRTVAGMRRTLAGL